MEYASNAKGNLGVVSIPAPVPPPTTTNTTTNTTTTTGA